jgi:gamma-glutamyl:cysteine ligase YbdK (ATP-grasp superfamily)
VFLLPYALYQCFLVLPVLWLALLASAPYANGARFDCSRRKMKSTAAGRGKDKQEQCHMTAS